jgi:hypothetical protein
VSRSAFRRVLRERESLCWLFVGPLIFTVFFGLLFRPGEQTKPRLAVVNRDSIDEVALGISPWIEQDGVTVTRMAGVERGRLKRIAMAPVSPREIVLGKLLGRFAIGWIQIVYMLGFGLVVGIRWADHSWVFFGFLSLFAVTFPLAARRLRV